jgi:hypothetical protein
MGDKVDIKTDKGVQVLVDIDEEFDTIDMSLKNIRFSSSDLEAANELVDFALRARERYLRYSG